MFGLDGLTRPIVQAPMAGGPSTPELAIAAAVAGGLGFLAAGNAPAAALAADIETVRRRTDRPFGVNVFADPGPRADAAVVAEYAATLQGEGPLGEPRHDDSDLAAKLELLAEAAPAVVSFTFGCPDRATVSRLRGAGSAVWITVTTPDEAEQAASAGADALVVQGVEAGGHRGGFDDAAPGLTGMLALLQLVRARVGLPLVAAGAIATGDGVAAVLTAGASAAQVGTALLLAPEAGTSDLHREALARGDAPTGLTRAFSGRLARGIVNRFMRDHPDAPRAYPEVHHLTTPLRAAARERGDGEAINLWAGEAYPLARPEPAAATVERLGDEARVRLAG